jgi:hypothetical protein
MLANVFSKLVKNKHQKKQQHTTKAIERKRGKEREREREQKN